MTLGGKAKFNAAGKRGEEADRLDASGLMPGDYVTVELPDGEIRITSYGDHYLVRAGRPWTEAETGETHGSIAVHGLNEGTVRFAAKRDPKADAEKAAGGEYTA